MTNSECASFRHSGSVICACHSFDQPNRNRIAIELPFACLNGGNDDENRVQYPKRDQNRNADKHNAENCGNGVINQHRNLEIERFLSMGIDFREIPAFHQPNDEGAEEMPQKMKNNPSKAAAWQSTHQVRISEEVAGAGGGGGIGC